MRRLFILALVLTGPACAASFDCRKASTFTEREICSNGTLGRLDEALAENYRYMLASDIGDGARRRLRDSQRAWVKERDTCTTSQCIEGLYRARLDAVCDLPVLSGVHPLCTTADEVE